MKNILILGDRGMLGHMVKLYLEKNSKYKIIGLNRDHINAMDIKKTLGVLKAYKSTDVIINCIGILNKDNDMKKYARINTVFPHTLASYCLDNKIKLIHISTNCVFTGPGPYTEESKPNATDLYGYSKRLGEVSGDNLTIRTTIIGPELKKQGIGLMHKFITDKNFTDGYFNIKWNGVTTLELSKYIKECIESDKTGIVNYYTKHKVHPNKYDIIDIINQEFKLKREIKPVMNTKQHQALLDGTNFTITSYNKQIQELYEIIKDNKKLYKGIYK